MKNAQLNTQGFISKLERINFTSTEDRDTLVSEDGFRLSYSTKLSHLIGSIDDCFFSGLPIQLLFRVTKDGKYVQSWGCMELEDTTELAKWYVLKKNEINNIQDRVDMKKDCLAKSIWDSI